MDKKRTIKCDCGGKFQVQNKEFGGIFTEAMVCSKCGYTTLTQQQAEELTRLKKLQDVLEKERKIIKIGNSIGITFPESMKKFGIHKGQSVKIEPLDGHSFRISVVR